MLFADPIARTRHAQHPRRFPFLLRAIMIAAVATFAAAGKAAGEVSAVPTGAISAMNWPLAAVEGQSFSGIVAAFTDSDVVTTANFTSVSINWGDGTTSSAGTPLQSGINSHLFFISGTHTFIEEGSFALAVFFHDVLDNSNHNLSTSTAAVDDAPLCVCLDVIPGAPSTFTGAGGNGSSGGAFNSRQAFESAIGGANNGATPAPQPGGFRALNWDGVKLDGTDFGGNTFVIVPNKTVGIPVNRFQERGAMFGRVYAVSNDGFAAVNSGVAGVFTAFSPVNDFAPFNTHQVDLDFVLPSPHTSSGVTAGTRGLGGIFINVHNPIQTSVEYFAGPISLGRFYVPAGPSASPAYSFLGVLFSQPIVTRVHLTLGSGTIFLFDGSSFAAGAADNAPAATNVVALDDLAFAEPHSVNPAPEAIITPTAGSTFTGTIGTFIDTDPNGNFHDFTALIDWGDGHTSPGRISAAGGGGFNISGSNTYTTRGALQITFSVEDFGGAKVIGNAEARVPFPLYMPAIVH